MQTTTKTLIMQRLSDAARYGYLFYTTGELDDRETLKRLTRKFAQLYETTLSKDSKYRRRRAGEATASLYILERPSMPLHRYWFALMATKGVGLIHLHEQLHHLRQERLTLDGYELVHDGRCWSWQMTHQTLQYWRARIHTLAALPPERRRRCEDAQGAFDPDAEHLLASLYRVPGFRLARRQVGQLVTFMRGEWQRLRPATEVQPRWRTFLSYVRRLPNPPQRPPRGLTPREDGQP